MAAIPPPPSDGIGIANLPNQVRVARLMFFFFSSSRTLLPRAMHLLEAQNRREEGCTLHCDGRRYVFNALDDD